MKAKPTGAPRQAHSGVPAIPPMIVGPSITPTTSAYGQLAVSNGPGTAPLVIGKGEALATLRQIRQTDVKHQQAAVIPDT